LFRVEEVEDGLSGVEGREEEVKVASWSKLGRFALLFESVRVCRLFKSSGGSLVEAIRGGRGERDRTSTCSSLVSLDCSTLSFSIALIDHIGSLVSRLVVLLSRVDERGSLLVVSWNGAAGGSSIS